MSKSVYCIHTYVYDIQYTVHMCITYHRLDNSTEGGICWELKERAAVAVIFDPFLCYRLSRIASLSKIFPTLMLYRLWEDGKIGSLDDPLEKYVENFTIKNPLGKTRDSQLKYVTDGLIFLDSGEVQIRSSSVTLRRMASQLSGTQAGQLHQPGAENESSQQVFDRRGLSCFSCQT